MSSSIPHCTRKRCRPAKVLCATMAAVLASLACRAQEAAPTDWESLFNGRNLDGWTPKIRGHAAGDNFGNTFRVVDGLLTVAYDGYDSFASRFGHLFFERPYSHYRLRMEYRFTGTQAKDGPSWATRNSGVMLHAQPPGTMGESQDFPISIEVQFLGGLGDGRARSTGNLCTPGTNVVYQDKFTTAHCINSRSPTFDGDQWVTAEILVLGGERMVHLINGTAVIEYAGMTVGGGSVSGHRPELLVDGKPLGAGHIALQSESHPVQFRRIELLNLKGCMDPASAAFRKHFVESDPAACK